MPSQIAVPSIAELLKAYESGVRGERDEDADLRSGAIYDLYAGMGAMVFSRLAVRDRDIFRAIYFENAIGDDLETIADERFHDPIIQATRGPGTAFLSRPSTGGGAGDFLAGTRITLLGGSISEPKTYVVANDTHVLATDIDAFVPVTADHTGTGVAIDTLKLPSYRARIEDPLWDNSWKLMRLACADGTDKESPAATRSRIRTNRFNARVGYAKAITNVCLAAGAVEVALFPSDFLATNPNTHVESIGVLDAQGYGDVGLNYAVVGDGSFQTTSDLLRACQIALDSVGIAGTALQALPMQPIVVTLSATVKLWDNPGRFAAIAKANDAKSAIVNYFDTRENPFYFRLAAIRGAIMKNVPDVQAIDLSVSYTVLGVPQTTEPLLPSMLRTVPVSRYQVTRGSIAVTVTGP